DPYAKPLCLRSIIRSRAPAKQESMERRQSQWECNTDPVCGRGSVAAGTSERTARNRRNQENAIALFQRTGFAAQEANVFFVEIDVQELANLTLVVADVAAQIRKSGGEFVESFGNRRRGPAVYSGRTVGEAPESGGDFDGDRHDRAFSLAVINCDIRELGSKKRNIDLRTM